MRGLKVEMGKKVGEKGGRFFWGEYEKNNEREEGCLGRSKEG